MFQPGGESLQPFLHGTETILSGQGDAVGEGFDDDGIVAWPGLQPETQQDWRCRNGGQQKRACRKMGGLAEEGHTEHALRHVGTVGQQPDQFSPAKRFLHVQCRTGPPDIDNVPRSLRIETVQCSRQTARMLPPHQRPDPNRAVFQRNQCAQAFKAAKMGTK